MVTGVLRYLPEHVLGIPNFRDAFEEMDAAWGIYGGISGGYRT